MATAAEEQRAVLLRGDDNVAVAARPIPKGFVLEVGGRAGRGPRADRAGAQGRPDGDRAGRAGPQVRPDHRVRLAGDPRRGVGPRPQRQGRPVRARLRLRHRAARRSRRCEPRTFRGFLRPDGRVGTRNYVAVISTVNCSASTSRYISERFRDDAWRKDFPNVDGVFAITHKGGCAMPVRRHPTTGRSSGCSPGSPTIPTSRPT